MLTGGADMPYKNIRNNIKKVKADAIVNSANQKTIYANGTNRIRLERESVCMGDDCNAPNAKDLEYAANELLSEFMDSVAGYVPSMENVVWSVVTSQGKVIAYLIFDENEDYQYELAIPDVRVSELALKKLYCRYYYKGKLFDYSTEPPTELYPECKSLLDKVKEHESRCEGKWRNQ